MGATRQGARGGAAMMRHTVTILIVCIVGVLFVDCLLGAGLLCVLAWELLAGWVFFLAGVLPKIVVDWGGILTAVLCLAGAGFGLHRFGRWFYRQGGRS